MKAVNTYVHVIFLFFYFFYKFAKISKKRFSRCHYRILRAEFCGFFKFFYPLWKKAVTTKCGKSEAL